MGTDFGIVEVIQWVTYFFPSLSEYTTVLSPILVFIFSVVGVFSNILPEPGVTYPVPEISDIDSELKGRSRIIYRLTRIARWITIKVNAFICTSPYRWFHTGTTKVSHLIDRLKGGKKKVDGPTTITPIEPYKMKLKKLWSDKKKKDE